MESLPLLIHGAGEPDEFMTASAPFDGAPMARVALANADHVELALESAHNLYLDRDAWLGVPQRVAILESAMGLMQERAEELALESAQEGGKPLVDSRVEVLRAIDGLKIAIEVITSDTGNVVPMNISAGSSNRMAMTQKEPIGVVVAVSAFNHPLNLIVHQVGAAVAAGCPVIVKPAGDTPLMCLRFVQILHQAALLDLAHAQDGDLRLVDDGGADQRAEKAGIRDGERAPLDFFRLQLLLSRALGQILNAAGHLFERCRRGVLDDGDDQSVVERDGDADVDVVVVADLVAFDRRVEDRKITESVANRERDEGQVGQSSSFLLERCTQGILALAHRGHVDLDHGRDMRGCLATHHHVLGDPSAHERHRLQSSGRRRHGRGARGLLAEELRDVLLRDSPFDAGPRNLREIDAMLRRHAPHQRRRAQAKTRLE